MRELDGALQNKECVSINPDPIHGGVSKGKVTEIYGPPGVGKTALAWVNSCDDQDGDHDHDPRVAVLI